MEYSSALPVRLCYTPALLPDELLYSYLTRIGLNNALGTSRCYPELFGTHVALPIRDLPTNLAILQQRLGASSPFASVSTLIELTTLYPYHRAFLPPEKHKAIEEIIRLRSGIGIKASLGRLANRFGANPSLRYCRACTLSDVENYGCAYWHRAHQLPGVCVCHKHGIGLTCLTRPYEVAIKSSLLLPPLEEAEYAIQEAKQSQMNFARLSAQVLDGALPAWDSKTRSTVYHSALAARGYVVGGRVDYPRLRDAIRHHHDDFQSFEHRARLLATSVTPLSWVRALLKRPERSSHPICHLVFIIFAFGNLRGYLAAIERQRDRSGKDVFVGGPSAVPSPPTLEPMKLMAMNGSCRSAAKELGLAVATVVLLTRQVV